jgi:hypothetical protein
MHSTLLLAATFLGSAANAVATMHVPEPSTLALVGLLLLGVLRTRP